MRASLAKDAAREFLKSFSLAEGGLTGVRFVNPRI
jgi:hypothetical protein